MKPKVCPFCGEKPTTLPKDPEREGGAWGRVACTNPECPAQPIVGDGIDVADDRGTKAYIAAAVKRWNVRRGK